MWALVPFLFRTYDILLRFIFWQRVASLLFILIFSLLKSKLAFMCLLLKMSLPPFHLWFIQHIKFLEFKFFLLFVYWTKIPYIFIFSNMWQRVYIKLIILFPLVVYVYFWFCNNIKYIIWVLSLSDFPWAYFSSKSYHFIVIYVVLSLYLITSLLAYYPYLKILVLFFYILRLPPFRLFQLKLIIIRSVFQIKLIIFLFLSVSNRIFLWLLIFINFFKKRVTFFTKTKKGNLLFFFMNCHWLAF